MSLLENNKFKILLDNGVDSAGAGAVWDNCLKLIKESIPEIQYRTWFLPIKAFDLIDKTLKIKIPSNLSWDFIEQHYSVLIRKVLLNVLGSEAKLSYETFEEKEEDFQFDLDFENKIAVSSGDAKKTTVSEIIPDDNFETFLNDSYTFDTFVEGEGNQLAKAASIAISNSPGKNTFNPFFVYGGVGLGKTHLVQAIGNYVLENKKARKVLYTPAEKFLGNFIDSIKKGTANKFSNFYREIDVLIIDDIQDLSGKEATADTFFHIFNSLHQLGKQIILTSDKPPKNLIGINERLISRFQWGLTVDIQPPDLETRMAILQNKCNAFGLDINSQIIEYIAINITSNIRQMEGCLLRLSAMVSLEKKDITLELVKEVVRTIATNIKPKLTIEQIMTVVAEHFNIPETALKEKTKKQEIVFARQIAMYFCKKLSNSTLKTIGLHFGGRDHTTVIHSINSVEHSLNDHSFLEIINVLQKKIEFSV